MKRLIFAVIAALALLAAPAALAKPDGPKPPVQIQILSVSDWHAQLEPVSGVGGAAALSAYFDAERAANPNTLTLTAGDAYGASPPVSSFFDEEPAVRAMRMMGFSADTFGNHNFDRGVAHLQRMVDLASAPAGSEPGDPFRYLSANLKNLDENLSGVDKWGWFRVGGLKVAVIGITNEEAPEVVKPGSLGTIEITDSVAAANKWATVTRKAGADVVIVITHKGLRSIGANGVGSGELVDFAEAVRGVDVVIGDHTDFEYARVHGDALVVENRSKGVKYARTNLTVVPGAGVTAKSTTFVTPTVANVTPDPEITAMINGLKAQLAPILGTVIGQSNVFVPRSDACGRSDGRLCESLVGNQTTDAMRVTYGTDFGITNAGGLRDALTCAAAGGGNGFCPTSTPPPWLITRGQVLAVLPFGNIVSTTRVTGAELKGFLENGVSLSGAQGRFAQVSGLCFTYDVAAASGSRVTLVSRQGPTGGCSGGPVDLSASVSYSLATNDFLAAGGDGYPNVADRSTTRELMDQVLADYVTATSPIQPAIEGRIVCTDSNGAVAPNCPTLLP
ncbi:MAG: 5'-nucleotidase C-terminal domain-containing protein [Actinobacteria bacterium]|nr:5'-nucleotidase C-terminal domain-containing protein [Actinomycetota bacterium]